VTSALNAFVLIKGEAALTGLMARGFQPPRPVSWYRERWGA
jgi:hypothetical protein